MVDQAFDIKIASQADNFAPEITSNPPQSGRVSKSYMYDAVAADDDGDPVTWSLEAAPIGMSINAATGAIRWTPRADQVGTHQVVLRATDPLGASTQQSFTIEVGCANLPPLILSTPPTQASVGETYFYGVRAVEPEGDALTFTLVQRPPDNTMTISPTGLIRWTPTAADAGQTRSVAIRVDDPDGGFVIQEFKIEVTAATNLNRAPVITSIPIFAVTVGDNYSYQVTATDADGDPLTYSLPVKPAWLSIDANGLITGTPPSGGVEPVVVEVSDGTAKTTQGFAINARFNLAPTIDSMPVLTTKIGATYRYSVKATDPDGDALTYSLLSGPNGMTIDGYGRLIWKVPVDFDTTKTAEVSIKVADPRGAVAPAHAFSIKVTPDTSAPTVLIDVQAGNTLLTAADSLDLGATATIRVTAFDDIGVASRSLEIDGALVPLDEHGQYTLTASQLGAITLVAKATDLAGNVGESMRTLLVITPGSRDGNTPAIGDPTLPPYPGPAPGDNQAPTVTISDPTINSSVTDLTSIRGTIDDPEDHLWYWRAYAGRLDRINIENIDLADPDLTVIATGTNEINAAEIAKFDPSLFTNDPYAILVAAFDANGLGNVAATIVTVDGNVKLGEFRLEFTDLSLPLAGIPITVARVYDSREASQQGDFGYGWMLGVQSARILEVGALGEGGTFVADNPSTSGKNEATKVYLTNPSGQRVGFTYQETLKLGSIFGAIYTPSFKPDPGVYDTLTIDEMEVSHGGLFGALGGDGINPNAYTLTTKDGVKYRYNQSTGLEKITDRNGNVITFSAAGIQHSSGVKIDFVRDNRGRITQIVAPDGTKVLYDYNAVGDLVKVTSQSGTTTTYTYLNRPAHFVDEAFDARGMRAFKVTYDDKGRYIAVVDGLGNSIQQQNYDELADRKAEVRDANGNTTHLLYDARGNVLEETDAAGKTTYREYKDPLNPDLETKVIDRNGMVTERVYDSRGNVLKIRELGHKDSPLATPRVTEFAYDSRNEVSTIKNAGGATTAFVYDGTGNLTRITNADNKSAGFTYDSKGRRKSFTDFNGNTTTFTYEGNNSQPQEIIAPDGTKQRFAYNQFGQVTLEQYFEANGTLVEQKQTFHDASGKVIKEITGANGVDSLHNQVEVRKFYDGDLLDWEIIVNPASLNPDGSLNESPATPIDQRLSRITDYGYDAAGRLLIQTDAEGGIVRFRYDAQGNRVLLQDPVGNITTWTYDALNRVAEERDPFYWVAFVSSHSNLSADALLDAVVQENKLPSGANVDTNTGATHVRAFGYDAEGNQSEIIDRNGRRREFRYDMVGRLLEETWYAAGTGVLVETITFTYDAVGNMILADDSNSHYVFTYDMLNRLRSVDNADTQNPDSPHVILYYDYDLQGNVTKTYDNAGVMVESTYNSRNLLATRKWYDATPGTAADVADARIDFAYNAAGRQTQVTRYNSLAGGAANEVGHSSYSYDLAGRTNLLRHANAADALLASYNYGYDFGGLVVSENRDHQDAQYRQSIDYVYDLTGQLISADFDAQPDEAFVYDANGNRLSATNGATTSTYAPAGPANQLTSDGTYRYEYDGEGNQVKRVHLTTGETTTYEYDHRNRLVRVEDWSSDPGDANNSSGGSILIYSHAFQYNSNDERIAIQENAIGAGQTPIRTYSVFSGKDVWIDSASAAAISVRYLFGNGTDQVLARFSDRSGVIWHIADHQRSVRDIAANSGELIERVEFTAIGKPVFSTSTSNAGRYLFTGREYEASTSLYFNRARYLDPVTSRFVSQDPLGFAAFDTNIYRYALNSFPNASDPSGKFSVGTYALLINGIAGAAFGAIGVRTQGGTVTQVGVGAIIGGVFGIVGGALGIFAGNFAGQVVGAAYGPQDINSLDLNEWSLLASAAAFVVPEVFGIELIATEKAIHGLAWAFAAEVANAKLPFHGPHEELFRAGVQALRMLRENGYLP